MRITGGQWVNHSVAVPPGQGVRPTPDKVRQAIFNSLGPWIENASVLELFAGSGALCLECLSRGAVSAVAVEKSSKHAKFIRRNAQPLPVRIDVRVQCALQAVKQLAEAKRQFDFICADPPYGEEPWLELLSAVRADFVIIEGNAAVEAPDWEQWRARRYGRTWVTFLRRMTLTGEAM